MAPTPRTRHGTGSVFRSFLRDEVLLSHSTLGTLPSNNIVTNECENMTSLQVSRAAQREKRLIFLFLFCDPASLPPLPCSWKCLNEKKTNKYSPTRVKGYVSCDIGHPRIHVSITCKSDDILGSVHSGIQFPYSRFRSNSENEGPYSLSVKRLNWILQRKGTWNPRLFSCHKQKHDFGDIVPRVSKYTRGYTQRGIDPSISSKVWRLCQLRVESDDSTRAVEPKDGHCSTAVCYESQTRLARLNVKVLRQWPHEGFLRSVLTVRDVWRTVNNEDDVGIQSWCPCNDWYKR